MQQEMQYIYEIYRAGSFSQAAKNLYLTQPALSIAVRKVEKALGYAIFDRSSQPLKLTEAGEIYYRHLLIVKQSEEAMRQELADLSGEVRGDLRLAGSQYFNAHILPPLLRTFQQAYPRVHIHLQEDNSRSLEQILLRGEADIICHSGPYREDLCSAQTICQDELFLAAAQDFPLPPELRAVALMGEDIANGCRENATPVDLARFAPFPFLLLTGTNHLRQRTLELCHQAGFEPHVLLEVKQLETIWHLAAAGLGLAFVTDLMIKEAPKAPMLYFELGALEAVRTFSAITRRKAYISHAMKAFLELFC